MDVLAAEDLESRLQSLRSWLGRPGAPGALTCRRIAELAEQAAKRMGNQAGDEH